MAEESSAKKRTTDEIDEEEVPATKKAKVDERSADDMEDTEPIDTEPTSAKKAKVDEGGASNGAESRAASPDPELLLKIQKQVEFYFSDANFRRGRFLKSHSAVAPDGLVSISTVLTFQKLKELTTDPAKVVAAAAASNDLKVSDDRLRIGRARPLPEQDTSAERTIYINGFGYDNKNITLDTVQDMMAVYGDIAMVVLRRDEKSFKGSAFVEFTTKEGADAARAAAGEIMYGGAPMEVLTFTEHRESKNPKTRKDAYAGWDAGAPEDETTQALSLEPKSLIRFTCVPESGILWKELKEKFGGPEKVKYMDMPRGATTGVACMKNEEAVDAVLATFPSGVTAVKRPPDAREGGQNVKAAAEVPVDGALMVTLQMYKMSEEEQNEYSRVYTEEQTGRAFKGGQGGRRGRGGDGRLQSRQTIFTPCQYCMRYFSTGFPGSELSEGLVLYLLPATHVVIHKCTVLPLLCIPIIKNK